MDIRNTMISSTSSSGASNGASYNGSYGATGKEPTRVEKILVTAERDLEAADFHFGFVLNPVRDVLCKPALGLASNVLPAVAKTVPFFDQVASLALDIPFGVARSAYAATHSEQFNADWKTYRDAVKSFEEMADEAIAEELLQQKGGLHTLRGFLMSATIEFASDPISNLDEWVKYTKQLVSYLSSAGISNEIDEATKSNRFILNMRVLGNVMAVEDNTQIRRIKTAIPGAVFAVSPQVVAK